MGKHGSKKRKRPTPMAPPMQQANPFDVIKAKHKHHILNDKVRGGERNILKTKRQAIQRRQDSLLAEFQNQDKAGVFLDRRIGETGAQFAGMTAEEKALERFTKERAKRSKEVTFNLGAANKTMNGLGTSMGGDSEILTHKGSRLAELQERVDAAAMADDMDDDDNDELVALPDKGGLNREETLSHFGTGGTQSGKSKKEVMQEVILKSKMFRAEKAKEHFDQQNLVMDLDADFGNIQRMLEFKQENDKFEENREKDEFTVATKKLAAEATAAATERLKTDAELAAEQKARLDALEAERLRRMAGVVDAPKEEDDVGGTKEQRRQRKRAKKLAEQRGDAPAAATGPTDDDLDGNYQIDPEFAPGHEDEDGYQAPIRLPGQESDDDNEPSSDDDYDAQEAGHKTTKQSKLPRSVEQVHDADDIPFTFVCPSTLSQLSKLLEHRTIPQQGIILQRIQACHHPSLAAENSLKLQRFYGLLLQHVGVVCADAALALSDGPKRGKAVENVMPMLNMLAQSLFDLSVLIPRAAAKMSRQFLSDIQERRGLVSAAVAVETELLSPAELFVIFIFGKVFPTSDFKHNVTIPTMLLLGQTLSRAHVRSLTGLAAALMACEAAFAFVASSKRLFPEAIGFLQDLMRTGLTVPDSERKSTEVTSSAMLSTVAGGAQATRLSALRGIWAAAQWPASRKQKKSKAKAAASLSLQECEVVDIPSLLGADTPNDAASLPSLVEVSLRSRTLATALLLIQKATRLYALSPSFPELFQDIQESMSALEPQLGEVAASDAPHVQALKGLFLEVLTAIRTQRQGAIDVRRPLVHYVKPKPLKAMNPIFQANFAPGRDNDPNKDRAENRALKKKVHKEKKGAMRELRKDTTYLEVEKRKEYDRDRARREEAKKSVRKWREDEMRDTNVWAQKKGKGGKGGKGGKKGK